MKTSVAIIDSGGANIASLRCALERLGVGSTLTADPDCIRNASHVILPGVGAAADAMQRLREHRLTEVVPALKQPVLGICLGMQLLAQRSEEDYAECLGILPASARLLPASPAAPVPNMGWCRVSWDSEHPLLRDIASGSHFYFVHSYALPPDDYAIATAMHVEPVTAIASRDNFLATQFHPERSAAAGARLLANFLAMSA